MSHPRIPIDAADIPVAVAHDEAQDRSAAPHATDEPFLTWLAGATVARWLGVTYPNVAVTWAAPPGTWPVPLAMGRSDGDRTLQALVVAEPSSMEPRPIWPVRVRVGDLGPQVDLVIGCYVPKRRNIEHQGTLGEPLLTLVGWIPAGQVREWPVVHAQAHAGHPFAADYFEGRCAQLRGIGQLAQWVRANTAR